MQDTSSQEKCTCEFKNACPELQDTFFRSKWIQLWAMNDTLVCLWRCYCQRRDSLIYFHVFLLRHERSLLQVVLDSGRCFETKNEGKFDWDFLSFPGCRQVMMIAVYNICSFRQSYQEWEEKVNKKCQQLRLNLFSWEARRRMMCLCLWHSAGISVKVIWWESLFLPALYLWPVLLCYRHDTFILVDDDVRWYVFVVSRRGKKIDNRMTRGISPDTSSLLPLFMLLFHWLTFTRHKQNLSLCFVHADDDDDDDRTGKRKEREREKEERERERGRGTKRQIQLQSGRKT